MQKRALITGITGQDGSYLADLLLGKGYIVYGVSRRTSTDNLKRVKHLLDNPNFNILYADITDMASLINAMETAKPDEFYNLAAQSFVGESWNQPLLTFDVTAKGCMNCLEAIRIVKKDTKFYQAGSSEMFGKVVETPQFENTKFYPRSPYGVAKVAAHYATINYRESYGMFCCNGILFNHESERRGHEFVTRKITLGIADIVKGNKTHITLGNLDVRRDWGHAKDYVEGMWLMLQQNEPDDYVLSSGETHYLEEFLSLAFNYAGIDNWKDYVLQDPKFMRPAEVEILLGNSDKARLKLGWSPKVSFKQLVERMMENDLKN